MDKNVNYVLSQRINRTVENLEKNNMSAYIAKNREEVFEIIKKLVSPSSVVSVGGSMTLKEIGVLTFLREEDYDFLDRYQEGLTREDIKELYRESFSADAYFVSSNAITEQGELYNVDGNGNRVAAMMYGPDKVIVIAGVNKIVKDLDAAIVRNREIAAPANTRRLDMKTPCKTSGYCMDCQVEDRICMKYTLIKGERTNDRYHVILLDESYGY